MGRIDRNGRGLKGQSGFALAYAFVGLVFVSTLFYFLSDYVLLLGKQTNRKVSLTHGRMVLHSFLDYTVYGIKQRWCFDDAWIPATPCVIGHPRSVERLIMSADSVRIYQEMVTAGQVPAPAIQSLQEITANVDLQGILPGHALYNIINTARTQVPMSRVEVSIARDRRPQMAVGGREMFLKISIRVLDSSGNVVQWQGLPMTAKADVVVFPREIGSFAMMASHNLHMDQAYNATTPLGDLVLHQFNSRSETAGWPGLVFESPVFVNGDIVLPSSPIDANPTDPHFAAVTFADKVYMGNGQILRNGRRFKPKTAGVITDQLWSHVREFGGFQRGIEVDGAPDPGLDVLSGRQAINAIDENFMQQCINLVRSRSRLSYTRDGHIAGVSRGGDLANGFIQRLGFSRPTPFSGQNWVIPQEQMRGGNDPRPPLGRFKVVMRTTGRVQRTIEFGGNDGVLLGAGETTQNWNYSPERSPEIREREMERDSIVAQLATITDPLLRAPLEARLAIVNTRIAFLNEVDARQGTLTLDIVNASPDAKALMYLDVRVRMNPPSAMVNSEGEPMGFSVRAEVYDVGCDRGRCRYERNRWNPFDLNDVWDSSFNQVGWLNFTATSQGVAPAMGVARYENGPAVDTDIADENFDWQGLENGCTYSPRLAFGGANWGTDFLDSTFKSWNFAPIDPSLTSLQSYSTTGPSLRFNAGNSTPGTANIAFTVKSLVNRCIIESSATFVSGFFNCRELVIEQRSTPLRIVGSFILGKLTIHPTAYRFGIRWSTIYHPLATQELISAGILRTNTGACQPNPLSSPIWHPFPSIYDVANNFRCNIISLRNQADPFTWTTVEPDCGLMSNSSRTSPSDGANTKCKNRVVRAAIFEISRESAL